MTSILIPCAHADARVRPAVVHAAPVSVGVVLRTGSSDHAGLDSTGPDSTGSYGAHMPLGTRMSGVDLLFADVTGPPRGAPV